MQSSLLILGAGPMAERLIEEIEALEPSHYVVLGVVDSHPPDEGSALAGRWLGGFSQGAVMTYALGLGRGRPRPAGLIALSGFIPTVEGFELDLSPPVPPVAIGHGTYDPVISVEWSRRAKQQLEQAGADVLYREYPLPHAIDPGYLSELSSWLTPSRMRASTPE